MTTRYRVDLVADDADALRETLNRFSSEHQSGRVVSVTWQPERRSPAADRDIASGYTVVFEINNA